jgi:hypothetical protein
MNTVNITTGYLYADDGYKAPNEKEKKAKVGFGSNEIYVKICDERIENMFMVFIMDVMLCFSYILCTTNREWL